MSCCFDHLKNPDSHKLWYSGAQPFQPIPELEPNPSISNLNLPRFYPNNISKYVDAIVLPTTNINPLTEKGPYPDAYFQTGGHSGEIIGGVILLLIGAIVGYGFTSFFSKQPQQQQIAWFIMILIGLWTIFFSFNQSNIQIGGCHKQIGGEVQETTNDNFSYWGSFFGTCCCFICCAIAYFMFYDAPTSTTQPTSTIQQTGATVAAT